MVAGSLANAYGTGWGKGEEGLRVRMGPSVFNVCLTLVSVVLIFKEEAGRLTEAPGAKAATGATRRKAEESFMVVLATNKSMRLGRCDEGCVPGRSVGST